MRVTQAHLAHVAARFARAGLQTDVVVFTKEDLFPRGGRVTNDGKRALVRAAVADLRGAAPAAGKTAISRTAEEL